MEILELFKLSIKSLFGFKLRSFLTTLGIIVGIGSVILISSLGAGFQNNLLGDINKSLSNLVLVSFDEVKMKKIKIKRKYYFSEKDLSIIEKINGVESTFISNFVSAFDEKEKFFSVDVLDKKGFKNLGYNLISGRGFNDLEYKVKSNVALISSYDSKRLYNSKKEALGKKLKLKNANNNEIMNLTIIGTYKDIDDSARDIFGGDFTKIIIPNSQIKTDSLTNTFIAKIKDGSDIKSSVENIKKQLLFKANNQDIYKVKPFSEDLNQITGILDKISIFISLVAAISLVVGGIGVMNIMLVSVTERISEIGLRKAIGAKDKDILIQFLIESVTLTLIGGIVGILFGYSLALLIGLPFKIIPIIKLKILMISIIVSMGTGLVFGLYPARKASKLSPMEALRSE